MSLYTGGEVGRFIMRSITLLMIAICAMALQLVAQDEADRATQSRIVALEKAWNQAYKFCDRKALDELLDDQLVLVNDDGSIQGKGEFLASIKKSNSEEQQVTPESITVHTFGTAASATGVFTLKGTKAGKPYIRRERFLDTWVYRDGKWRCATAAAITEVH
jgi:ketosteroid isomerase-like protein